MASMNRRVDAVGIGFIGAGMISDTYLENLSRFPDVEVLIVGDLNPERAATMAAKHGVPAFGTPDDVLAHTGVELVVNLTIPTAHAAVSSAALAAGKHVWSEKPMATDRASAQALLDQAEAAGLYIGVAPDTMLSSALQTAFRLISEGAIGTPIAASTTLQYAGPDLFHPGPEFLFAPGAGPVYDIGPYYLTALAHALGPVARVAAFGAPARPTRTIKVGERAGTEFPVMVPTHISAVLEFERGAVAQSLFSFESPLSRQGVVEITGTDATMVLADPNTFDGEVRLVSPVTDPQRFFDTPVFDTIPVEGIDAGRGVGALDLARVIRTGGTPVASGELGYHVLDTIIAIDEACRERRVIEVDSTLGQLPLLDRGWDPFERTVGSLAKVA